MLILGADPRRAGPVETLRVAPPGFDPRCAWLALLGQDPLATWQGAAPLALAAEGRTLGEEETAYRLTPVAASGGVVTACPAWGAATLRSARTRLAEPCDELGVSLALGLGELIAVLPETVSGPPVQTEDPLEGRALDDLPAGPPGLLSRLLAASARACAALGHPGGATHLWPQTPAVGPARAQPLREAWLGLGPWCAIGGELAAGLAGLLGGDPWPTPPEQSWEVAGARHSALVVLVEPKLPAAAWEELARDPARFAVASAPRRSAAGLELELWVGGASGGGLAGLRAWALGG